MGQKIGQLQIYSPFHQPPRSFQSKIIFSTPRNHQPRLATVTSSAHQPLPNSAIDRPPALASPMWSSPVPQSRPSQNPPLTSLKPVSSTSNHSRA
ncbi:hypothetical protein O181_084102 [Austropuccinia psidii MF-1]|uniref:Uncharacterized protein n=1 Tax=Austropuccinia psidii MF-1 TaxID=1389203 RepID=A0A9Q3FTK5_9BASI|nr:hypothetical protein [Austropuccinia psidii MF-1]